MKKMSRIFFLSLYYGLFRYLPVSYTPAVGKISKALRVWCCRHIFEYCGKNVNVERGAYFGPGTQVRLGDNSGLGVNCRIKRNTVIGKDVLMGPGFVVQESRHKFDRTDITIGAQGERPPQQVVIGDDVWIGSDVMVVGQRTVPTGCILAARTVLVKDFEPYSIIGGNPSRLIRKR